MRAFGNLYDHTLEKSRFELLPSLSWLVTPTFALRQVSAELSNPCEAELKVRLPYASAYVLPHVLSSHYDLINGTDHMCIARGDVDVFVHTSRRAVV